jgi:hypothetical protein
VPESIRLSLRLELTDPVTGTILVPDGPEHDFVGWLEMYSMIEATCQTVGKRRTSAMTGTEQTDGLAAATIKTQPGGASCL